MPEDQADKQAAAISAQEKIQQDVEDAMNGLDSTDDTEQYLTFSVNANEYGVDIMKVREIRGWSDTTRIPNSPNYMRGVINLRGLVIPIFDLRTRFNMGSTEVTDKNVVIVIAVGARTIGILVDAVSDILTVSKDEIKDAPQTNETDIDDRYVDGLISVEDKMVIVLDVDFLFDTSVLIEAEKIAS